MQKTSPERKIIVSHPDPTPRVPNVKVKVQLTANVVSQSFTDPSPLAVTNWFSLTSLQHTSNRPSWVSKLHQSMKQYLPVSLDQLIVWSLSRLPFFEPDIASSLVKQGFGQDHILQCSELPSVGCSVGRSGSSMCLQSNLVHFARKIISSLPSSSRSVVASMPSRTISSLCLISTTTT